MLSRNRNAALSITVSAMLSASLLASAPLGPIEAAAGPAAASAVLQQAFSAIRQTGWSGSPEAPAPAATPVASIVSAPSDRSSPPALTAAEMNKINGFLQSVGTDQSLDQSATQFIGLTTPGEILTARQIKGTDDNDTVHVHYFSVSKTDPNVIILFFLDKNANILHGYLTNKQFQYISGYLSQSSGLQALTPEEGAAGLAAEIRWWAQEVDSATNS